ncbi:sensor histidine kinase [Actinocatenispora rupis]|uniref:histidine kinase n=1 Tax=Actinocatenispora rupis TaxID=519421 RepID=A0A8J3JH00_9ACTN|nr:HAMP domain-containing sensor histidine kinase [Actinocatenispora rupis]GID14733.1 two-component sensor histidine kinase [Actinocatenispora rupis]
MRRRLLIAYLSLLGVALVAFLVPLSVAIAQRETQSVFIDRVNDTTRFASIAEQALPSRYTSVLQTEMTEYDRLYGVGVAIVLPDGTIRLASRGGIDPFSEGVRGAFQAALSGTRAQASGVVWPWQDAPMVVAEPIGNSGMITGVVVTVSPTGSLRATIAQQLAVLAAIGLVILAIGAALAVPITRWLARPLNELDEVTHAISRGELTERVHDDTGPPELRRFATSFNTMADRLATLIERQRGFISYASHQLRTPLATVRLRVENLGDAVPVEAAEDHRLVLEEVDRLAAIFESLLTFVRTGAEQAELVDLDAGAIADARVASWQPVAEAEGVTLTRSGVDTAPVRAASETLDQVIDALVHNAIKNGGRGSTVDIAVRTGRAWVDVHVTDDGPGMTDDQLASAVKPFWRRHSDRNQAGAGLGLAIADALVTASGGQLELRHAFPTGVDARVRLAARPPDPAPYDEQYAEVAG